MMQKYAVACVVAVAIFSSPIAAEERADKWMSQIKHCVHARLDAFSAELGNSSCPYECAHCFTEPLDCISSCANQQAACACAQEIPQALGSLQECCTEVWDIFADMCHSALESLEHAMVSTITHICDTDQAELDQALAAGPALAQANEQSSGEYVGSHRMGSACMSMLEDLESEHAAQVDADEMPNLLEAAEQIAQRASDMLGRESPALKAKVHKAMAVAWSEDGPGMDSRDVCEVILRHHDGL
mmetsp:Transcript_32356/g.76760  ORF Transcript_32356/g.76760 Transcript_32356/m.76760 type:complete len:244 (+) Transcript_32356:116-847(+)